MQSIIRQVEKVKSMTNAQLNAFLETLARLIEAKATTPEDAARIVRAAMITTHAAGK